MVNKKKREGESNESLIRSFTRDVRGSGLPKTVKAKQAFARNVSKNRLRDSAERRRTTRAQREQDIKTGKLVIPTGPFRKN